MSRSSDLRAPDELNQIINFTDAFENVNINNLSSKLNRSNVQ